MAQHKGAEKGKARREAIFALMQTHKLNLPRLTEYINAKDDMGFPLHSDVSRLILPDPTKKLTLQRIHQMLSKMDEYRVQSSWKTTRESVNSKENKTDLFVNYN